MNTNKIKKLNINLVPDGVNPSPDYYCTWQTQLYATCDGKPKGQRAIIGEKGLLTKTAPARIARGCLPAEVTPDENGAIPDTLTCKHPDGAFSIVTAERSYFRPRCAVFAESNDAKTIGIFGCYESLTLKTEIPAIRRVLMQDLAGDAAYDITEAVTFEKGLLTLSGHLIQEIGTSAQPKADTSEPGVVVRIETP